MSYSSAEETEDPRTAWRRRLQQRRCLVCGARDLIHATSYFCAAHIATHRYCSTCETLRPLDAHGRDSRCKACARARALTAYHQDSDRCLYRIRLRELRTRQYSRADQLFIAIRRRIALADLVAATPGWSWRRRAEAVGWNRAALADAYRRQTRGLVRDADMPDRAQPRRRRKVEADR